MSVINRIFKSNLVQKYTRIKAYKTIIRPVLAYEYKAWKIRETHTKRLTSNEMKFFENPPTIQETIRK